MTRFVLRRLVWSVVVVWFVVSATFLMLTVIPADPARALPGPHATPETVLGPGDVLVISGTTQQVEAFAARS